MNINLNINNSLILAKNQRPIRAIRSYVLRQGRMTEAQFHGIKQLWSMYGIDFHQNHFNLSELFDLSRPIVLEIGFGMGESLIAQARHCPEVNFIGIDVHKPGMGRLLQQLKIENLSNVRVFCHDAVEILQYQMPPQCLDKIQIFFPDPWPKKKHHKRRLIQTEFVQLLHQKLKPNGILHIATDWQDYAKQIQNIMLKTTVNLFKAYYLDLDLSETDLSQAQFLLALRRYPTKFELRGKKLGHGIWDLIYKKI